MLSSKHAVNKLSRRACAANADLERIMALTTDIPPDELDKPPIDGAAQLAHYLYGAPKRPE